MRNRLKRPERLKRRERLGTLDRTNRVWRERLALLFAAAIASAIVGAPGGAVGEIRAQQKSAPAIGRGNFEITEATIAETHAAMRAGKLTCRQLVEGYLRRIRAFDQPTRLNAIVVVNPNADCVCSVRPARSHYIPAGRSCG